jgi:hypothetical protein
MVLLIFEIYDKLKKVEHHLIFYLMYGNVPINEVDNQVFLYDDNQ